MTLALVSNRECFTFSMRMAIFFLICFTVLLSVGPERKLKMVKNAFLSQCIIIHHVGVVINVSSKHGYILSVCGLC